MLGKLRSSLAPANVVVVVCVVALAVLSGCGGDDGNENENSGSAASSAEGSDEQAVRDTVEDFYASFQDPKKFCAFLSARLRKNGGRERCEKEQQRYADAGAERELKETKVTVKGAKATTKSTVGTGGDDEGKSTEQWVKEGGEWKIDG